MALPRASRDSDRRRCRLVFVVEGWYSQISIRLRALRVRLSKMKVSVAACEHAADVNRRKLGRRVSPPALLVSLRSQKGPPGP